MSEIKTIEFSHKEVAEALVRFNNIHEGLWGISIRFGIQGANIGTSPGGDLTPAAIVPILNIGLQRFEKPNNLTVDAAIINPSEMSSRKKPKLG
ncbi:MAG: hypothetical protein MUQ25_17450 [Candidatus Aminicenantes bacterium]|nr:hypothetical protein [Candidatus Aminicenantes bacterium]